MGPGSCCPRFVDSQARAARRRGEFPDRTARRPGSRDPHPGAVSRTAPGHAHPSVQCREGSSPVIAAVVTQAEMQEVRIALKMPIFYFDQVSQDVLHVHGTRVVGGTGGPWVRTT